MPDAFDPYHRWLGIPPEQQPADHYRLLGVDRFEGNLDVIRDAAERQMAHVRRYQLGPQAAVSQTVLNELAAAKACLLDPARRVEYDRGLAARQAAPPALPPVEAVPVAAPPRHVPAVRWTGRGLVLAGLLLIIAARGCDNLGQHSAELAHMRLEQAKAAQVAPVTAELRAADPAADQATPSLAIARMQGRIEPADDKDLFVFQPPRAGRLTVSLSGGSGALDAHLTAYDGQRQELAKSDDEGAGKDSLVELDVEPDKTYYLEAASNAATSTGPYELRLELREPADDFPNDFSQASRLMLAAAGEPEDEDVELAPLRAAHRDAATAAAERAQRAEWLRLAGTTALVLGLAVMGFSAAMPESWAALAMLGVVLASLLFIDGKPAPAVREMPPPVSHAAP